MLDAAIFKKRFRTIERVFAWEDKFRRVLIRSEVISEVRHALMTLAHNDDPPAALLPLLSPPLVQTTFECGAWHRVAVSLAPLMPQSTARGH